MKVRLFPYGGHSRNFLGLRLFLACATLALALPGAGCAKNATMDGELTFPARPAGFDSLFVVVAARRDDTFDQEWNGVSLPMVHELTTTSSTYRFSLETTEFDRNAYVKLRLCRTEDCQDLRDPVSELWYELQKPFYQGQLTSWSLVLERFPLCRDESCTAFTDPDDAADGPEVRLCNLQPTSEFPVWRCHVGRCEIGCGLVAGLPTGGSCMAGDGGPHFCE